MLQVPERKSGSDPVFLMMQEAPNVGIQVNVMNIFVVGSAGHIGSHRFRRLVRLGCEVTPLDKPGSGHRAAVQRLLGGHTGSEGG